MLDYAGLQALAQKKEVHLCFFLAPHLLTNYEKSIKSAESVTLAYENTRYAQKAAAEIVMGGLPAKGKLPVAIASLFDYQTGLSTQKVRLSYQSLKEAGMSEATLRKIAPIVEEGIRTQAFPGCQVLVAKNGKVVYNRSFGYFDYAGTHPVENTDVYDLASVTKAVATVPAVMKLYDIGKIKLDDPLSKQIPLLQQTDKYQITIRDALFHQTGLASFLPFYMLLIDAESYEGPLFSNKKTTVYRLEYDKNTYMRTDFKFLSDRVSNTPKAGINKQVADHFYVTDNINDWAIRDIADSQLRKEKKYLYSDLNFILLKEVVENVSNQSLDVFLDRQLYAGLGANYTEFLPLRTIAKEKIAPTENDRFLRNQVLIGYPHDEAAAVLGGISGNAGLFSNANDLAKIGQLFLNKGTYGGERFFDESTVKMFTHTQNSTGRRGLGFDKPNQKNLTFSIPENIFGHTGYTGTCWWVDPDNQLIYVFLSNRVYPSRQHTQLQEQHIRERIQSIIYEAIR
jgi:CubicO group peptidase (beta-lactamase class C family)